MKQMKKNFIWNLVGTLVNSFSSLFFLIIVTRINGVDDAGIFTFAFSTACLFQVIANYSGRTYQVTDRNDKIKDNDFIVHRIYSCILMFLISIFFILIKGYTFYKCIIMLILFVTKIIESYSDVYYGIIQKNEELDKVGKSLFLKGIFGILLFLLIDYFSKDLILASFSLILVNFTIFIIYDLKNSKKFKYKSKINYNNLKLIFISGFSVFFFTFLTQYLINAPRYAIDNILSSNYQTIFGIIIMPSTLMILCSQFLIQPFLTTINNYLKSNNIKKLNKMLYKFMFLIFTFGIISEIFIYFFGIPILKLIYGINLHNYLNSLLIIIFGATLFGMSYIISTILIAQRKNTIQIYFYLFTCIVIYILSNILVKSYGILGASISYFVGMLILFILYFIYYILSNKKYDKINIKEKEFSL